MEGFKRGFIGTKKLRTSWIELRFTDLLVEIEREDLSNLGIRKKIERAFSGWLKRGNLGKTEKKSVEHIVSVPPSTTGKIYLKALSLRSLEEVNKIKDEIRSGNILIVKIEPLAEKSIEDANRAINELSEFVGAIGGDIARLGEERIVLTPPNVRIWKEKTATSHASS